MWLDLQPGTGVAFSRDETRLLRLQRQSLQLSGLDGLPGTPELIPFSPVGDAAGVVFQNHSKWQTSRRKVCGVSLTMAAKQSPLVKPTGCTLRKSQVAAGKHGSGVVMVGRSHSSVLMAGSFPRFKSAPATPGSRRSNRNMTRTPVKRTRK